MCQRTARESTTFSRSRPFCNQIVERIAVGDADHVLLDDRAIVEHLGDVVAGGADQLHAAGERLVVGLGADERRQERVVNVDDAVRILDSRNRWTGSACSGPAR